MNAAAIRRCRAEQALAADNLRRNGEDFQAMLWLQDWLHEETLLLLERRHKNETAMKVTYRARFRQPVGVLNPMGVPVPAVVTVEVFEIGRRWRAREIDTRERRVFERLGEHIAGAAAAQAAVEASFAEQIAPWRMHAAEDGRALPPEEVDIAPDGTVTLKPLTHITDFAAESAAKKERRSVHAPCGKDVSPKVIISVKAGIPPTCPACREVYEREYAHARTA